MTRPSARYVSQALGNGLDAGLIPLLDHTLDNAASLFFLYAGLAALSGLAFLRLICGVHDWSRNSSTTTSPP